MVDQTRILVRDLNRFTEQVISRIGIETHANLVQAPSEGGTPVDTGWARANWVPSLGKSFEGTAGTVEQAEQGRIDSGKAQRGLVALATRYRLRQGPVFISNNVPYIGRLNDGSSTQAPKGFVQSGIQKTLSAVEANPPRQP